jgi:hypothetical protein
VTDVDMERGMRGVSNWTACMMWFVRTDKMGSTMGVWSWTGVGLLCTCFQTLLTGFHREVVEMKWREKEFVLWRCRHDQMEWKLCAIPGLEASPLDSTVAGLSF